MNDRHVIMSGLPGAGKTTLGRALAAKMGRGFVDTDELLANRAGSDVASLMRQGEPAFRELEASVVREALRASTPHVIALGGGAVTTPSLRHELCDAAFVVTLNAPLDVLVARTTREGQVRPLIASDPMRLIARLADARRVAYAECHVAVDTAALNTELALASILEAYAADALLMPLGERSYPVTMVADEPESLASTIARLNPTSVVVVTDSNVETARASWIEAALTSAPRTMRVTLTPGEAEKNIDAVRTIWDAALAHRVDRGSILVALGGGVVGDLTGFAASTLLRGLRVVQVPTSLLAMVDASVGGKTGFDHPSGKNLIGAFHQPSAVLCDIAHLDTLPHPQFVAGLAEIVKMGLTLDASLFESLERNVDAIAAKEPTVMRDLIRRSIQGKVRVVRDDEHERGVRTLLNAGHTVGHAIETAGAYETHLHGEAVALGLVAELEVGVRLGLTPNAPVERTRHLLKSLGLPTDWRRIGTDWRKHLGADKKRRGGQIAFPVLDSLGLGRIQSLPIAEIERALV